MYTLCIGLDRFFIVFCHVTQPEPTQLYKLSRVVRSNFLKKRTQDLQIAQKIHILNIISY